MPETSLNISYSWYFPLYPASHGPRFFIFIWMEPPWFGIKDMASVRSGSVLPGFSIVLALVPMNRKGRIILVAGLNIAEHGLIDDD
jgi:hypothetical protein